MVACDLDWELIAKVLPSIIASITALFIYSRWSNQKGSEVIANEAKNLIIKIASLQSLQCEILKILNDKDSIFPDDKLIQFKEVKEEVSDSMNFLGFALKKDKALSQLPSMVLADAMLFIRDIERYKNSEKDLSSKFNVIDSWNALTLTEMLLDYAMYKKRYLKRLFSFFRISFLKIKYRSFPD
jgi:hypothetical protein